MKFIAPLAIAALILLAACQTAAPPEPVIWDVGEGLVIRPGVLMGSLDDLDRWTRHFWERRDEFREENATLDPNETTVVLLGDSLTEGWKYEDRIANYLPEGYHYLNRGITSDHILGDEIGLLRRMDESVYDCQPSHVFFVMGVNDLGRTWRREGTPCVARVFAGYRLAVDSMIERCPGVKVCLVTTSPVGGSYEGITPYILEYNILVRDFAEERGLPMIDLFALLADEENHMPEDLSTDRLHFNSEGFEIYGEAIAEVLASTD